MLSLLAKLGLDVEPFRRGLDAAKGAAGKAGDEIAKNYGGKLKNYIFAGVGLGAIVAEFQKVRQATDKADLAGKTIRETLALERVAERVGDTSALAEEDLKALIAAASAELPEENALRQLAVQALEVEKAFQTLEGRFIGALAALLRFSRGSWEVAKAFKDAGITFFTAPLSGKEGEGAGANGFAGIAQAWDKANKAFLNSLRLSDAQLQEEASKMQATLPRAKPEPEGTPASSRRISGGSRQLSAASAVQAGGLAASGLFFGGAGSGLYREARQQTEYQRQTVAEIRRLQAVFREEL